MCVFVTCWVLGVKTFLPDFCKNGANLELFDMILVNRVHAYMISNISLKHMSYTLRCAQCDGYISNAV